MSFTVARVYYSMSSDDAERKLGNDIEVLSEKYNLSEKEKDILKSLKPGVIQCIYETPLQEFIKVLTVLDDYKCNYTLKAHVDNYTPGPNEVECFSTIMKLTGKFLTPTFCMECERVGECHNYMDKDELLKMLQLHEDKLLE